MEINWRKDSITKGYIKEHPELLGDISKISAYELGNAATYCESFHNPFVHELLKRSGHIEKWNKAGDDRERRKILDKSCRYHGFRLF